MNNDLIAGSAPYRSAVISLLKRQDLVEFVEQNAGVTFAKTAGAKRWACLCPMPHHKDTTPSFGIWKNHDGMWFYKCFGCGSSGTIIDFWMDFAGLDSLTDAVIQLADHLNLDESQIVASIGSLRQSFDEERRFENQHLRTADVCRRIWQMYPNDPEVVSWIDRTYRRLNQLLAAMDPRGFLEIQREALEMLQRGGKQ